MPFCTSCGKEVASGKKFCEYCGTPLEQTTAPSGPAAPAARPDIHGTTPSIPEVPARGSGKTWLIAGIVCVLIIIAGVYFVGLPLISGTPGTSPAPRQMTALPTPTMMPVPAIITAETTSVPLTTGSPSAIQTYEPKYMETYTLVYETNRAFAGGQKVIFTQDLATPPLYIKFNITPKMFYEERPVEIGLASEHIANISYVSQDAWFKARVYDADNGDLKEEQGFNKEHGTMTQQEFMVRAPGNYRVELSGNDVIAEIRILTGKSG